jgi:PPP family 3-phenylpropionic acid transporter
MVMAGRDDGGGRASRPGYVLQSPLQQFELQRLLTNQPLESRDPGLVFLDQISRLHIIEGSHALHDSFSVIRWRSAGIDFFTVSALWSESVFAEVVVFLLIGPWLVRRIGPSGSMALAAGAGVLRWTVAAFTTSPGLLACIQPLHGLTFALFHLAAIRLIVAVAPIRLAATAQAIYGTLCIGLAISLLTFASGLLYARAGGEAFLFMTALCLLALPICAGLRVQADPTAA